MKRPRINTTYWKEHSREKDYWLGIAYLLITILIFGMIIFNSAEWAILTILLLFIYIQYLKESSYRKWNQENQDASPRNKTENNADSEQ